MRLLLGLVLIFSGFMLNAQPLLDPPPVPPPPNPVPITGIELLIGAGAMLGVKKILDSRKTNT